MSITKTRAPERVLAGTSVVLKLGPANAMIAIHQDAPSRVIGQVALGVFFSWFFDNNRARCGAISPVRVFVLLSQGITNTSGIRANNHLG